MKKLALLACIYFLNCHSGRAEHPPHRLGYIVSLTGGLAEFGEAIRNGATLALEERPELGRFIELVFEDSKYDSQTSITNFHKLHAIDQVSAIYVFGGPMTDTLSPIAERYHLPMISTEYDTRYSKGKRYVFRFANNAGDYATVLLNNLRKNDLHHFAIVKVENQYHNTLFTAFTNSLKNDESFELLENYHPGETDFRTTITRLGRRAVHAVGIYLPPGMQNAFLRQLQSTGMKPKLFGTDTFESREENRGVEVASEGAIFVNSYVSQEFIERYRSRFKVSAQIVHAALSYEFTKLAGEVLAKGPLTSDEFVSHFNFEGPRHGVCGDYYFRDTAETGKYFSFPLTVRKVINGVAIPVETFAAP